MHKKAFVFEDERAYWEGYEAALRGEGWEVETATSLQRAREILGADDQRTATAEKFNLYIVDILEVVEDKRLPNGVDILKLLNLRSHRRLVIVPTALTVMRHVEQVIEQGVWSFIVKDPDVEKTCQRLVEKVKEAAVTLQEREACRTADALWARMTCPEISPPPGLSVVRKLCPLHRRYGGDFCWAQASPAKESLTLALGDITDKGPAAGLVALLGLAALQFATEAPTDGGLVEFLLKVNQHWCQLAGGLNPISDRTIDMSILRLRRTESGWFAFVAGLGAPPAVLLRAGEGREVLDNGCFGVGIEKSFLPRATEVVLRSGDVMVLVTDGLHPTGNHPLRGQMTSAEWPEQLERIVRPHRNDLSAAAEAILANFSGNPPTDDRSVLLIRCEEGQK